MARLRAGRVSAPLLGVADLLDLALVAAALAVRVEEHLEEPAGHSGADHALAEAEHVRVVVEPGHPGLELGVAERGADALVLVRDDAHPDAGAADEDAESVLAAADALRDVGR